MLVYKYRSIWWRSKIARGKAFSRFSRSSLYQVATIKRIPIWFYKTSITDTYTRQSANTANSAKNRYQLPIKCSTNPTFVVFIFRFFPVMTPAATLMNTLFVLRKIVYTLYSKTPVWQHCTERTPRRAPSTHRRPMLRHFRSSNARPAVLS